VMFTHLDLQQLGLARQVRPDLGKMQGELLPSALT
jgi:hypothetical protein